MKGLDLMRAATIALLSILMLAACGAPGDSTPSPPPTPSGAAEVAHDYISATQRGDCDAVVDLLSSDFKATLGGDAGVNEWCAIAIQDATINLRSDVQVLSAQPTGPGQATVPVVYTNVSAAVRETLLDVVMEGDTWKIQGIRQSG